MYLLTQLYILLQAKILFKFFMCFTVQVDANSVFFRVSTNNDFSVQVEAKTALPDSGRKVTQNGPFISAC